MNKNELVAAVAESTNMTKVAAGEAVDATFDAIAEALKRNDVVRVVGFGTFLVSRRAARKGVNPSNSKPIEIEAANLPKFRPGKALKDALN